MERAIVAISWLQLDIDQGRRLGPGFLLRRLVDVIPLKSSSLYRARGCSKLVFIVDVDILSI